MKVLFLGSGTSTGVPVIGCNCAVCRSEDPRNTRFRSSILVTGGATTLLVDSGPDLRQQALRYGVTAIDAVLYTHEHLDHVAGFDEMRAFCWHRNDRLPLYAGTRCMEGLKRMYGWAFADSNTWKGYIRPAAHDHRSQPFTVGEIEVTPVPVIHGTAETHGYVFRHGDSSFGYVPDVKRIPESSVPLLSGLDVLAMDGLCFPEHHTHFTVDQNVENMKRLRPKRGLVTHSGHRLEFSELYDYLPPFMEPAYDGLTIEL